MRAATIAGDPNPWVIIEKWVKWRWILGSRICWGLVLHNGLRSWFNKSINSLTITLKNNKKIKLLFTSIAKEMNKYLLSNLSTPKKHQFFEDMLFSDKLRNNDLFKNIVWTEVGNFCAFLGWNFNNTIRLMVTSIMCIRGIVWVMFDVD